MGAEMGRQILMLRAYMELDMGKKAREVLLEDEQENYKAYVRMGEVQLREKDKN